MEASFWHKRWENHEIAFHEKQTNPLLIKYFPSLDLENGKRIFIPLCGKSLDIAWFLSEGYQVVGAELSKIAIDHLFQGLGEKPNIKKLDEGLEHYSAESIDIFVGDLFHLTKAILGSVDAIYDRAALVALPKEMRNQYTKHLTTLTENAAQLLICYQYDQSKMDGPPFSISNDEVREHYESKYILNLLASEPVPGGLKKHSAIENVWLLKK
ncbi:MAG: thiopurine S-methyltransferase [Leptospira sp.]|nr:thiopurine S-methyltransferase [Leptospira sp.]